MEEETHFPLQTSPISDYEGLAIAVNSYRGVSEGAVTSSLGGSETTAMIFPEA
jgi:hypothetical protein